jgi:hypothetical protein
MNYEFVKGMAKASAIPQVLIVEMMSESRPHSKFQFSDTIFQHIIDERNLQIYVQISILIKWI